MAFANPQLLWLAPLLALFAAALVLLDYYRSRQTADAFGERTLLGPFSRLLSTTRFAVMTLCAAGAAAALVLALARPILPSGSTSIATGTVDVVVVADVSRSMAALDYDSKLPPRKFRNRATGQMDEEVMGTRLEMVQEVIDRNLLPALSGNQIGVVSYAGEAFPQAFLTRDQAALRWVLSRGMTISSAPGEGSGMARALAMALAMFEADSAPGRQRLLVLFSDGGNDDKPAELAAVLAELKAQGITVLVVGMGNTVPAPIPVRKLAADDEVAEGLMHNGKRYLEVDGQVEKTALNANLLRQVAQATGGKYVHLTDATDLDLREHVGGTALESVPGTKELFPQFLAAAFVLLLVQLAASRRLRKGARS